MKKKNNDIPNPNQLNEDELNMLKHSVESEEIDRSALPHYDNSDRARLFRHMKSNKVFTAACILLAVFVLVVIGLCIAVGVRIASQRVNTDDFTVFLGDEKYTVKYEDAVRKDILYIDMYKVSSYAQMTRTGSASNVKFTASENNYLRFENGTDTAVINGSLVNLGGTARVNKSVCEIPIDFLIQTLGQGKTNGLKISVDLETNTVKINRRVYKTEDKDVFLPVEILFSADSFDILQSIQRPDPEQEYEYIIDVSEYLSSIDPDNAEDYLVLANKQTPLGEDYSPADLVPLECKTTKDDLKLREDAANALFAMMLEMTAEGITDVSVTSAYRSYSYQNGLFNNYVKKHMEKDGMTHEEAEEKTLTYSARPGTSEHQTGLCIDFIQKDMRDLDETFEDTAAFRWLSENAHKYGFILRYPADKVDTTGYKYEPWHYRFVGRTAAAEIYNSDLCLEEYLELN